MQQDSPKNALFSQKDAKQHYLLAGSSTLPPALDTLSRADLEATAA